MASLLERNCIGEVMSQRSDQCMKGICLRPFVNPPLPSSISFPSLDGGLLFQLGEREMRGNLNLTDEESRGRFREAVMGLQNQYIRIRTGVIVLPEVSSMTQTRPPPVQGSAVGSVGGVSMKKDGGKAAAAPGRKPWPKGRTVRCGNCVD